MTHIHHTSEIALPREFVWGYLSDLPRGIPEWLFGVTDFSPEGTQTRDLGARFTGRFQVKPVTLHSTVEVVAWVEHERITLRSVAGFQQETTIELCAAPEGCVVTATVDYALPGGVAGKAVGRALGPIFAACVRLSDARLREQLFALQAASEGS